MWTLQNPIHPMILTPVSSVACWVNTRRCQSIQPVPLSALKANDSLRVSFTCRMDRLPARTHPPILLINSQQITRHNHYSFGINFPGVPIYKLIRCPRVCTLRLSCNRNARCVILKKEWGQHDAASFGECKKLNTYLEWFNTYLERWEHNRWRLSFNVNGNTLFSQLHNYKLLEIN